MILAEQIQTEIKEAMKAGDRDTVTCLRMLLAAVQIKEKDLRRELSDDDVIAVVRSQLKQVRDSFEQFTSGGRDDLAAQEEKNLAILKRYLPAELSAEELTSLVTATITELEATKKDFGKVMKTVLAKVQGRADGKMVKDIVAKHLA